MKILERIKTLSLEEKAALLQGATTWTTKEISHANIPAIFLADGPHGMRKQAGAADHLGLNESIPATCFPTAATMANSWNVELGEELGGIYQLYANLDNMYVVDGKGVAWNPIQHLCTKDYRYICIHSCRIFLHHI